MAAENKELVARNFLVVGPPRTEPGRLGKPIKLSTNSFAVQWRAPALTAYSISFDPEIAQEDQSAREFALATIRSQIQEVFGFWSFDGLRLIGTKRIDRDSVTIKSPDGKMDVTFAFGQEIDVNAPHSVAIVNQFFKRQLRDFGLFRMQRNFFERDFETAVLEGRKDRSRVRLYHGYATSIEPTLLGLQLQVDVVHRLVRDQTVRSMLDRFEEDAYRRHGEGTDRAYDQVNRDVKQHLVGRTMVLDYNNWTWRIDGVDWDMTADSEFVQKDGSKITFRKYIMSRYKIKIDGAQPGVLFHVSKRKKETLYFLPELCRLTGISPEERADFQFMKSLADRTKLAVDARFDQIRRLPMSMNESSKAGKKEPSPLSFSSEPTAVDGRILGPFQLLFNDGQERTQPITDREVNFPNRIKDLVVPNTQKPLKRWMLFADGFHRGEVEELIGNLERRLPKSAKCSKPEMTFFKPQPGSQIDDSQYSRQFVTHLERCLHEGESKKQPFDFVVFVIDDRRQGVYEAIKEFCLTHEQLAVFSQVILTKSLRNPARMGAILENVMRQVFTKVGAIPWKVRVSVPNASKVSLADTMFIGLDVCHFRASNRSTVGVCASMDPHFSVYNSFVIHQQLSQEILLKAKEVMLEILRLYGVRSRRGDPKAPMVLPKQIVIFRDGVSNSQMKQVLAKEVEGYKQAFQVISDQKYIGGPYNPKLTVLIVQKRVSLRMVPEGLRGACPPGTVVDTGIVSSEFNDFYLVPCAPHPNVGTATPTRYVILVDEIGFAADDIQQVSHQFCSYYYNWTGAIRVPAPCMYAHKIAYLFGKTLKNAVQPHGKLQGRPFFL